MIPDYINKPNTVAIRAAVHNRGSIPLPFVAEMVAWAKNAGVDIFDQTPTKGDADIYNKVRAELGPYSGYSERDKFLTYRKAVMLEVLRVLAGFESSWDWNCGVDTSKNIANTPENAEAGAWQVSADSRRLSANLRVMFNVYTAMDEPQNTRARCIRFQQVIKEQHEFAMRYEARLLRINTEHNGPLIKGLSARKRVWPDKPQHWKESQSIYPYLSRDAVAEWVNLLEKANA